MRERGSSYGIGATFVAKYLTGKNKKTYKTGEPIHVGPSIDASW
jgi:hypothetical protein